MSLQCDWCDKEIAGKNAIGYSIEAMPFRPLAIAAHSERPDVPRIVAEIHLHGRCRSKFFTEVWTLLQEHEPTPEDQLFDPLADDETGATGRREPEVHPEREQEEKRRREWDELPPHERERLTLESIGDGTGWVTNREVSERLWEGDGPAPWMVNGALGVITRELHKKGELEKQTGQWGNARIRYRRVAPSNELRELAEQLSDEGGG